MITSVNLVYKKREIVYIRVDNCTNQGKNTHLLAIHVLGRRLIEMFLETFAKVAGVFKSNLVSYFRDV